MTWGQAHQQRTQIWTQYIRRIMPLEVEMERKLRQHIKTVGDRYLKAWNTFGRGILAEHSASSRYQIREPQIDWDHADKELQDAVKPTVEKTVQEMGKCDLVMVQPAVAPPITSRKPVVGEPKNLKQAARAEQPLWEGTGKTHSALMKTFKGAKFWDSDAVGDKVRNCLTRTAEALDMGGLDPRLASMLDIKVILPEAGVYGGKYWVKEKIVSLNEDYLPDNWKIGLHEVGHGFDFQFLSTLDAVQMQKVLRLDGQEITRLRIAANEEYAAAKELGMKLIGLDPAKDAIDWFGKTDHAAKLRNIEYKLPVTAYSIVNETEWFAESWQKYFGSRLEREMLQELAPKTFEYIDKFSKGKLFKEPEALPAMRTEPKGLRAATEEKVAFGEGKTAEAVRKMFQTSGIEKLPEKMKELINKAAQRLEAGGMDPRIAELMRISEVRVTTEAERLRDWMGAYMPGEKWLALTAEGENIANWDVVSHELAHGVEDQLIERAARVGLDVKMVRQLRNAMREEWAAARGDAANKLGLRSNFKFTQDVHSDLGTIAYKLKSVTPYALADAGEWFAESWMRYFTGPVNRQRLARVSPKTYEFIDKLATGKLFKEVKK